MVYTPQGTPSPSELYLAPTEFLDHQHPSVLAFASQAVEGAADDVEKGVRLYYSVRDSIRYDPYRVRLDRVTYRASNVLAEKAAFCLPKANLLAASARAVGIPAAIGLSDVRNHLCTERLQRRMGGRTLFLHHGYAVLYLGGQWLKAAPAFNIELCDRFQVLPTEFDGRSHALFQEFDANSRRHMEYTKDHGIWSDFPYERVIADFREYYPESFFDFNPAPAASGFEMEEPLR